jgi:hypothetical protein
MTNITVCCLKPYPSVFPMAIGEGQIARAGALCIGLPFMLTSEVHTAVTTVVYKADRSTQTLATTDLLGSKCQTTVIFVS